MGTERPNLEKDFLKFLHETEAPSEYFNLFQDAFWYSFIMDLKNHIGGYLSDEKLPELGLRGYVIMSLTMTLIAFERGLTDAKKVKENKSFAEKLSKVEKLLGPEKLLKVLGL